MTPARFAGLLLVLMAFATAVWLATDRPSRAPSSGFAPEAFLAPIAPKEKICIPRERVPAGAAGVQLTLGAFGRKSGTAVSVNGSQGGRKVLVGRRAFREAQDVYVPFAPAAAEAAVVEMCLVNIGRFPIQVGGKPGFGPSVRYPGAERGTWVDEAGTIADRFQRVRLAPFGSASLWVFLLLGIGGVLLGTAVVVTVGRR